MTLPTIGSDNSVTIQNVLDPTRICEYPADPTRNPNHAWFGTKEDRQSGNCVNIIHAKSMVFRYALFGHKINSPGIITGKGSGSLLIIAQDEVRHLVNDRADNVRIAESSTFMHELGHILGLQHWGNQKIPPGADEEAYDCKPNYFSVMNYYYVYPAADPTRPLDYSSWEANTLNEDNSLDERIGVRSPTLRKVLFGTLIQGRLLGNLPYTNEPIDWDRDLQIDIDPVSADVNAPSLLSVDLRSFQCKSASPKQELDGYDDWKNLRYNFRDPTLGYPYSRNGENLAVLSEVSVPVTPDEPTVEELQALGDFIDYDDDGFPNNTDNCPAVANPDQRKPEGVDCGVSFGSGPRVYLPLIRR